MVFPSSHCSVPSTTPFPHIVVDVVVRVHPQLQASIITSSTVVGFPSSQADHTILSAVPSEHKAVVQDEV